MQVPCISEASKACSSCCRNPFFGQPESPDPISLSKKSAINPQHEFIAAISSSIQPNTWFTNHESLPPFTEMYSNLQNSYPFYSRTDLVDQIRSHEYYHLSNSNHVYLDYIGHGLFSYSQQQGYCSGAGIASTSSSPPPVQRIGSPQVPFFDILHKPASLNSMLQHGGKRSEFEFVVRRRIMKYLNISGDDYSMVFTANQISSFKLLANSYPFQSNNKVLTVYDYKNEAAEAMIESSVRKGATAMAATFSWPNLRVNSKELRKMIIHKGSKTNKGLFVFPLQSRITGARYSYQWMNLAQENGWHVLLDADALREKEMETLGLTLFRPDFIVSSFFKVFGENPSGFSCLFVKKSRIPELNKSSKSIGIVSLVPTFWNSSKKTKFFDASGSEEPTLEMLMEEEDARLPSSHCSSSSSSSAAASSSNEEENLEFPEGKSGDKMQKEVSFSEYLKSERRLESEEQRPKQNQASSSNINYNSEKIEFKGLDHADEAGLILISSRVRCHVNWLVNALIRLRHPHSENGVPLVKLYGPNLTINRGPYVAMNVFDWKGEKVDPFLVQRLADRNRISVGCGILQNLWFKDTYKEEKEKILEKEKAERYSKSGKFESEISVVTVSIGFMNNVEDLHRFWAFISRFLDADFVEKERWRYMAINQTMVELQ